LEATVDALKSELARNSTGYFLVIVGLIAMGYAHHAGSFDKMVETGAGLVGAALLAFQSKHVPEGNTSTVSVTTPEKPETPKV
jgi:hypothetical protein